MCPGGVLVCFQLTACLSGQHEGAGVGQTVVWASLGDVNAQLGIMDAQLCWMD